VVVHGDGVLHGGLEKLGLAVRRDRNGAVDLAGDFAAINELAHDALSIWVRSA
jgi:hypothetical protein